MMQQQAQSTTYLTAVVMVIVAVIVIQIGAALSKQLFPVIGPQGTSALRLLFASIILSLIWRPWKARLTRQQLISIALYGLSLGGMNLLIYLAFQRIPLGIAVALEFTGPLTVALLASRKPLDFIWVILAVTGIVLLLPVSQASKTLDPLGIFYALGAGLCWALYIVFGRKSSASIHGGTAAALGMIVGTMLAMPFGIAVAGTHLLSWAIVPTVLMVAVLSSVIPYSLEIVALKHLPMKTFGILMSLEPAMGALAGFVFLSEQLAWIQCFAIGCIILASIGSTLSIKQTQPPVPELVP